MWIRKQYSFFISCRLGPCFILQCCWPCIAEYYFRWFIESFTTAICYESFRLTTNTMRIGIAVLSYVMPCNYWLSANTAKNGAAAIYLDKKKACFSEILVHIYYSTCRQSSYSSTSDFGRILNKCNIKCIRCSRIWNTLPITYSRNVGLLNKVYEHWPLLGFRVAIIYGSEEHVPLFTPSLGRYTAPHFVLGLVLQVTISYASMVHKPTACKYPKFVFALSGGIHNVNSFQSQQGKRRCDFFVLCCLQNDSHTVHCSFFACLNTWFES